jgi:hypothetical protein
VTYREINPTPLAAHLPTEDYKCHKKTGTLALLDLSQYPLLAHIKTALPLVCGRLTKYRTGRSKGCGLWRENYNALFLRVAKVPLEVM